MRRFSCSHKKRRKIESLFLPLPSQLCQVLDGAEFCRNVHADASWRGAAESVVVDLGGYVHELNTHYGLYTALMHALRVWDREQAAGSSGQVTRSSSKPVGNAGGFSEETVLVGRMLQRDFERYGVHLDGQRRDRMTALVAESQLLGMQVTQNLLDPGKCGEVRVSGRAANQLPQQLRRQLRPTAGGIGIVVAPGSSSTLAALMQYGRDEEMRRAAYIAYNQQPVDNVDLVGALAETRREIAELAGFPSYAHYQVCCFVF
jgi:mitochondrial intermediate peptidase